MQRGAPSKPQRLWDNSITGMVAALGNRARQAPDTHTAPSLPETLRGVQLPTPCTDRGTGTGRESSIPSHSAPKWRMPHVFPPWRLYDLPTKEQRCFSLKWVLRNPAFKFCSPACREGLERATIRLVMCLIDMSAQLLVPFLDTGFGWSLHPDLLSHGAPGRVQVWKGWFSQ